MKCIHEFGRYSEANLFEHSIICLCLVRRFLRVILQDHSHMVSRVECILSVKAKQANRFVCITII